MGFDRMSAKLLTFSALVASAAAFAPALSGVRTGATSLSMSMDKSARAPIITIFDHRGCSKHTNKEYTGGLTLHASQVSADASQVSAASTQPWGRKGPSAG